MAQSPYIPRQLRQLIADRAHGLCEYCQSQQDLSPDSFEIDHIIPLAWDGETTANNLCQACPTCNNAKRSQFYGRDPKTGHRVRLFNPRRQVWERHFRWSQDSSRVIGRTAIGRATVETLDMNRPRIIQIRLLWAAMGLHPFSA